MPDDEEIAGFYPTQYWWNSSKPGALKKLESIYRRHYARLWRYYRTCRVSDDEGHDLAQDAFKRLYEHIDLFRGQDEAVWPFLEKIALNVFRNWLRAGKTAKRSANVVELDDPEFTDEPPAPEGPDYADREQAALRRQRLQQAIAELKSYGFGEFACSSANDYITQYILTYQPGLRVGGPVAAQNPKLEIRNPKQIQDPKFQ